MKNARPDLKAAKLGYLTQGTVFSCVKLDRYGGASLLGLVITARCDIAQDKFPVLNYLPLVPIHLWFQQDGLKILQDREEKNFSGKLKNLLARAELSEGILVSISLPDIGKQYFSGTAAKQKKFNASFWKLVDERQSYLKLLKAERYDDLHKWFCVHREKEIDYILDSLFSHSLMGNYLFEKLLYDKPEQAYICLLREVASLPCNLAVDLSKGLSKHVLKNKYPTECNRSLEIRSDELAMPLVCVASPTIEHVMQAFSNLFARIGLNDPDGKQKTLLKAKIMPVTESP